MSVSRRYLLRAGTIMGSHWALGCASEPVVEARSGAVFLHGVASGDPLEDAVILWTRLSGVDLAATVSGKWQVVKSLAAKAPLLEGRFETSAERDFTVKVDVTQLEPNTTYYYRFEYRGVRSHWGRTRTLPVGSTSRLRFGVVSCAAYAAGYFHAYRALAERADLDAIIHLGDYIYEHGNQEYGAFRDYDPPHEVVTLNDYRRRYAHYRRDSDLQAIHQQFPFLAIWDDHEVANNAWRDGAENHQPDEGSYADRKQAASQAYFEWLPVREREPGRVHRSVRYGSLAHLVLADTRHWGRDELVSDVTSEEFLDPARSILGNDQERWLEGELRAATATWRILAQQVVFSSVSLDVTNTDAWDGYQANRERVIDWLREPAMDNVVILSGDIHMSWAFDVLSGSETAEQNSNSLAVELVAPSVTSPSLERQVAEALAELALEQSHVRMAQLWRRGYLLLDIDQQRLQGEWYLFDRVDGPSREHFFKAFEVRVGERFLREVAEPSVPPRDAPELAPLPELPASGEGGASNAE